MSAPKTIVFFPAAAFGRRKAARLIDELLVREPKT